MVHIQVNMFVCAKFSMKKSTCHWRNFRLVAKCDIQYKFMLLKKGANRVAVLLVVLTHMI